MLEVEMKTFMRAAPAAASPPSTQNKQLHNPKKDITHIAPGPRADLPGGGEKRDKYNFKNFIQLYSALRSSIFEYDGRTLIEIFRCAFKDTGSSVAANMGHCTGGCKPAHTPG